MLHSFVLEEAVKEMGECCKGQIMQGTAGIQGLQALWHWDSPVRRERLPFCTVEAKGEKHKLADAILKGLSLLR
jgi:hypothetical protein